MDDVVVVINISHDDRDGSIAIISKITACSSICCTLVQLSLEWGKDAIEDEGGKDGREGASLIDPFLHEERAPVTGVTLDMDCAFGVV